MGIFAVISTALKSVREKIANKLVEYFLEKSKWKDLVDPSERRDDLQHQDDFSIIRRQFVDDFGMTWKQATEFAHHTLTLDKSEMFDDVYDIVKDFGAYE